MELQHLVNREPLPDRKVSAGETIEGVQICPVGDWPNGERVQHCTAEALQGVVDAWAQMNRPEILVDFEHRAEQGGTSDTSAAAWCSNLRVDPARGLVGDFKMTDAGAEAVSNRRLRFLSVGWYVNKATREPMRITSIALTNKPNIPVDPVLNREPAAATTVEEPEKGTPAMEKLKELLGLSPEASDEDVAAAVTALKDKVAAADQEKAEAEAEAFAEQNKEKCDKGVLKAQFLANREVAKALVAGIPDAKKPEAEEPQQVLNKENAKSPEPKDIIKELNKLPAGEARVKFVTAHAKELAEAN